MKHKDQWSVYDTNVQAYRSNFISSQSLLLTVGALFIDKSVFLMIFVTLIALFQMWYVWFPVIRARTIISDFHKFNAKYEDFKNININGEFEENTLNSLTEEVYVDNNKIRKKANAVLSKLIGDEKLKHNFRITRIKLDRILPVTFSVIWIVMCIYCVL